MAIDMELRDQAEELYVINGLTLEEVSKETGIPLRTLQSWSAGEGWKVRQKEYRDAAAGIRHYTRLTKLKLIKDAMRTLDPQKVYAFAALERATAGGGSLEGETAPTGETRDIRTAEEAAEALQEAVERKLNIMLSRPEAISLNGIKDMKKALELIESMRAKGKGGVKEAKRQLDPETLRIIKEQVYGIV